MTQEKKVFLAGSTGMVGAALLQCLIHNFPEIKIKATYHSTTPYIFHEQIEYVQADLQDIEVCKEITKGCDWAILAAAQTSGIGTLSSRPWEQINANLTMNANLFQSLHEAEVKRVVWIGSASAYQEFSGSISEDDMDLNKEPPGAYLGVGWVMRYLEKLGLFWHQQGMEVVLVRASNIFGPYARFNPQTSNFIPALIRKAVEKLEPFEVWGSPDVTRDVIYASDFARAIIKLLINETIKFDIFNVGSEIKTTVGQVVDWALKYAEHKPNDLIYQSNQPTSVKWRALNCSKIKNHINWYPKYTIEHGIQENVQWWKVNQDLWKK